MLNFIIVAGGKGTRLGSELPKQFLELSNRPIICYSIDALFRFAPTANLIIALPKEFIDYWDKIKSEYYPNSSIKTCIGGSTRFESVRNALQLVDKSLPITMVHDAARPLITKDFIAILHSATLVDKAVIPGVAVTSSLRVLNSEGVYKHVDRQNYVEVQTPQSFETEVFITSYQTEYQDSFTDDASVIEYTGYDIKVIEGLPYNLKITKPGDIEYAEILMKYYGL
jgi:2-C-methyl-D-erythritol 4-phosphate cytidylyltransferase